MQRILEVTEVYSKFVMVDVENENDSIEKAQLMYKNGEVDFNDSYLTDTIFEDVTPRCKTGNDVVVCKNPRSRNVKMV